jgi:hypothetical protein
MRLATTIALISLWPVAALEAALRWLVPASPALETGRCFLNQRAAHSHPSPEGRLESSRSGKGAGKTKAVHVS